MSPAWRRVMWTDTAVAGRFSPDLSTSIAMGWPITREGTVVAFFPSRLWEELNGLALLLTRAGLTGAARPVLEEVIRVRHELLADLTPEGCDYLTWCGPEAVLALYRLRNPAG